MQGLGPPWTPRGQLLAWVTQPQGQDKEPVLFPPGKVPVPLKPPPPPGQQGEGGEELGTGDSAPSRSTTGPTLQPGEMGQYRLHSRAV